MAVLGPTLLLLLLLLLITGARAGLGELTELRVREWPHRTEGPG